LEGLKWLLDTFGKKAFMYGYIMGKDLPDNDHNLNIQLSEMALFSTRRMDEQSILKKIID
jgi:hypothetical protein